MKQLDWADKKVEKLRGEITGEINPADLAKALRAVDARAVRIVKNRIKAMKGATPYQWEKGYQQACTDLLADLQRKGK